MNSHDITLEPEQLDLLRSLIFANDSVPPDRRTMIRGVRGDNKLILMHPGFPEKRLSPNEFDLAALSGAGLIRSCDQGGRKGWRIDVLPQAKQYLASLEERQKTAAVDQLPAPQASMQIPTQKIARDPKAEASEILERVIQEVEQETPALESVLRRCARAAHLMAHQESAAIFNKEIRGYFESDEPPFTAEFGGLYSGEQSGSMG